MKVKEIFKAPQKLADNTEAAVVISTVALIISLLAIVAATRKGGQG